MPENVIESHHYLGGTNTCVCSLGEPSEWSLNAISRSLVESGKMSFGNCDVVECLNTKMHLCIVFLWEGRETSAIKCTLFAHPQDPMQAFSTQEAIIFTNFPMYKYCL